MRSNSLHPHQIASCLAASLLLIPALACSQTASGKGQAPSTLEKVADIPMPGPAVRFDYQSLDAEAVDTVQLNLTPHRLFYAEKRQFFLENAGAFNLPLDGGGDLPFFSRQIGIDQCLPPQILPDLQQGAPNN